MPDLVIDTYEKLEILEFWQYSEIHGLKALALDNDMYTVIDTSRVIPGLPISEIAARLTTHPGDDLAAEDEWREWLRARAGRAISEGTT